MRLALAQINPTVGDIPGNAALAAASIAAARDAKADLVVLPELCVSGYPPKDLLLQEDFVTACAQAAKQLGEKSTAGITAVFGCPLPASDKPESPPRIANSLLVYRDNALVTYYDKRLLPTYDVFDEDRYFVPGVKPAVFEVGREKVKTGLAICEDLWKGEDAGFASRYLNAVDPVIELQAAGAQLLISPSASPFVLGKGTRHREILRRHAIQRSLIVASVNQVGGNDDLIFDGHSAVYSSDGFLLAAAPGFKEHLLVADVDPLTSGPEKRSPVEDPLLTSPPERLLFEALVLGTRDYCRKTGFKKAVLGLSGGIDSAVTAAIAAAALGPENVTGMVLPGAYSSEHSKTDAYDLAKRLSIAVHTVGIDSPVNGFRSAVDPLFRTMTLPTLGEKLPDLTEENLQSRVRGTILMTYSNRTGAIVLTTGNKSELAVGYCTLYGDMNGGLAVLSDVTKQLVYGLSRWINANHSACGFAKPPIPQSSIDKAPSAELRPNQTDQDSLPPYDVLDEIIGRYVEARQSPRRIIKETGFDSAIVAKIVRLIDLSEYKRKQAAVGLKVTSVAFGSGRRVPIAQKWRGAPAAGRE